MFAKLNEMKKNKKGFTLVELIVVLVILAILAALLIPALTGYITKAKEKSVIAETRQAVMAAQTIIDEQLVKNDTFSVTDGSETIGDGSKTLTEAAKDLSEVPGTIESITADAEKVSELKYTNHEKTCVYDGKDYSFE